MQLTKTTIMLKGIIYGLRSQLFLTLPSNKREYHFEEALHLRLNIKFHDRRV